MHLDPSAMRGYELLEFSEKVNQSNFNIRSGLHVYFFDDN